MAKIGYARVSSPDQDLTVQIEQLEAAGCERIFREKASGRKAERPVWLECLRFIREGDVLVFTRLDRIGRSLVDLVNIGTQLQVMGVQIMCLQQPVNTTTPEGRLMWGMLAAFAEFEVDLKGARQREGIDKAKAAGKYKGRKAKITRAAVAGLKGQGLGASDIARDLGCSRRTVYRAHPEGWGDDPPGGRLNGNDRDVRSQAASAST
jgi:DNA invertase Pin-like site-specific DNA recombinase